MHPPGPATPHTSSPTPSQVLHDLDLVVVDSAGVTHTANGNWSSTNTTGMSSPNGVASFSEANNVEKVAISIPVTGTYSILITAGIRNCLRPCKGRGARRRVRGFPLPLSDHDCGQGCASRRHRQIWARLRDHVLSRRRLWFDDAPWEAQPAHSHLYPICCMN